METSSHTTRREFLSRTGKLAAVSAFAGMNIPWVHAAGDSTVHLALIGCGGRGTGAVANAFGASSSLPVKLVAMADVVPAKMTTSFNVLAKNFPAQMDVTPDRQFMGFDAYKHAIDCLKPGDVAMLTTHCGFRPIHLEYAVQKGVNVFMEKSFAADPAGTAKVLRLGEEAEKKNLKIACGLMCRHSAARESLIQKIREGELGLVELIRARRMIGGLRMDPVPATENELIWQIRHPYSFFWTSNGWFIDYLIHNIDECCWIKDSWPVKAEGLGGRTPDGVDCSQNYHTYAVEYTFADGTKAFVDGRCASHTQEDFVTYVHGSKCAAQFSGNVHAPTVHIYRDQQIANQNITWKADKETASPYDVEWRALLDAIRNDTKYNESKRSCYTNYACQMGRAAVHTGQIITWDQITASTFQFAPGLDTVTANSPAPVHADAQGQYPVPVPTTWKEI